MTRAHIALMEALIAGKTEGEAAAAGGSILLAGGGAWHRIAISHGDTSEYLGERSPDRLQHQGGGNRARSSTPSSTGRYSRAIGSTPGARPSAAERPTTIRRSWSNAWWA